MAHNQADMPDLPEDFNPQSLYHRASFRFRGATFKRTEPGEYRNGNVVVYCDQQDSTAWTAKCGSGRHSTITGAFWAPEHAVAALLQSNAVLNTEGAVR